jgi:hypothetical protein
MMKSSKIAKYARMASDEAHEEYMNMGYNFNSMWYTKDLLSEMIDKFDRLEAMARDNWFKKLVRKVKYGKY